jgi:hypothetical protein
MAQLARTGLVRKKPMGIAITLAQYFLGAATTPISSASAGQIFGS